MPETTANTLLDTDLLTPLGAYLRLRASGGASFLLESVDQGRLGRYSLVGCGTRSSTCTRPSGCDEPVVGHVGYDWIAELEPTVPLPDAGPGLPVSRFVVAETLLRFDHVGGVSEVLRGDPEAIRALLEAPADVPAASTGAPAGPARSLSRPGDARAARSSAARSTSAPATPSRSCSRSGPSGRRRLRRSRSTARCAGSTLRRTCSCSSSATTRWSARRRRRT